MIARSTEPFSFIILKKTCSFLLIITLIYYTYDQFSQFTESISKPNLIISKQHIVENKTNIVIYIVLCGSTLNYCENCNMSKAEDYSSPDCIRYSLDFKNEIMITLNITAAYLYMDGIKIDNNDYRTICHNKSDSLHYVNGQTNFVNYSPTIIKRITNKYAYGLAGGEEEEYVDFNAYIDHITSTTPDETTFILRLMTKNIYYQKESYYERNYQLILIFEKMILF